MEKETKKPVLSVHKVDDDEFKKKSKGWQWGFLILQLTLSFLAAFSLYNQWEIDAWTMVANQEVSVIATNILEVVLFIIFLIVGTTAYNRGFWNSIYKWMGITLPIVAIVFINWLLLEQFNLPIGSGMVILGSVVVFYFMFSTSTSSLSPMGFIGMLAIGIIALLSMNHYIFESTLSTSVMVTIGQFILTLIFFIGVNFSKLMYAFSGVLSTQRADVPGGTTNGPTYSGNPDFNEGEQ